MYPWGKMTLWHKILKKLVPKESLFVVLSDVFPIVYNKPCIYVLEINIFKRDYSDLNINLQYICKIYCREQGQYLMQFDALEKGVMGLQIRALKNFNKWTPVYKDY